MIHFFDPIADRIPFIIRGIPTTLLFTALSVTFGFIWGTALALAKVSSIPLLPKLTALYTSLFRGTPLIVQLSLVYYSTPQLTNSLNEYFSWDIPPISPLVAAVLTFTLNSGAYISETI